MKRIVGTVIAGLCCVLAIWFALHRKPAHVPGVVSDVQGNSVVAEQEKREAGSKKQASAVSVFSAENSSKIGEELSYRECTMLVRGLARDLSEEDMSVLCEFLLHPQTDFPELYPRALNSIKNDVLSLLLNQGQLPARLGQQIAEMYSDPDTDYMWKEYCLQHMGPYIERQSKVLMSKVESHEKVGDDSIPHTPSSHHSELEQIRAALFAALDERDEDLAATALLRLNRLSQRTEGFSSSEVIAKAVEIASDPSASDRCRLTAVRMAAASGCSDILPTARILAVNAQSDLLRGAAVMTLGDFGEEQDIELLTELACAENDQLSTAALMALTSMETTK